MITRIGRLLTSILGGGNPQKQHQLGQQNDNFITRFVRNLIPTVEASRGEPHKPAKTGQDIDLAVADLNAQPACAGFGVESIKARVLNKGSRDSGPYYKTRFVLDNDMGTYNKTKFEMPTGNPIAPGASQVYTSYFPELDAGIHRLDVIVDPDNTVAESDESNNSRSVYFEAVECSNAASSVPTEKDLTAPGTPYCELFPMSTSCEKKPLTLQEKASLLRDAGIGCGVDVVVLYLRNRGVPGEIIEKVMKPGQEGIEKIQIVSRDIHNRAEFQRRNEEFAFAGSRCFELLYRITTAFHSE